MRGGGEGGKKVVVLLVLVALAESYCSFEGIGLDVMVVRRERIPVDPFHLDFHACAMDCHVLSAGSRGERVRWVTG